MKKSGYILNILEQKSAEAIPANVMKELYQTVIKITKIKFPKNKRFSGRPVSIDSEDKEFTFSIGGSYGNILVVQTNGNKIPNLDKLAKEMQKYFGSVYADRGDYLNCQLYGQQPEKQEIVNPKTLPKLPQFKITGKEDAKQATSLVHSIRDTLDSRKAKMKGTFQGDAGIKLKIVKRLGKFETMVSYNDNYYFYDNMSLYQVKDVKEGEEFFNLYKLYVNTMRALEVHDWKRQDMSNPYG